MATIPERFRPAVVIFVDEMDGVYDHFCDLCAGLNPVLWPGVGMLRSNGMFARVAPLRTTLGEAPPLLTQRGMADDGATLAQELQLAHLFARMLRAVQNEQVYQRISEAGISVPEASAQIFIVGPSTSPALRVVAQTVSDALRLNATQSTVIYLIQDVPPSSQGESLPGAAALTPAERAEQAERDWLQSLTATSGELPLVNFCFFFEEMSDRSTFYDEASVQYVMAEALFGLIATGIPSSDIFHDTIQASPLVRDPDARVGSLAPVMIRFPRAAVTDYCAGRLAERVMDDWQERLHEQRMDQSVAEEQDQNARNAVWRVANQLADAPESVRPHTETYRKRLLDRVGWFKRHRPLKLIQPSLQFMYEWPDPLKPADSVSPPSEELQDALEQDARSVDELYAAEEKSFEALQFKPVKIAGNSVGFSLAAREAYFRSAGSFHTWQSAADRAYARVGQRFLYELETEVDGLLLSDLDGFNVARNFTEALDTHWRWLSEHFMELRAQHESEYAAEAQHFRLLGTSPRWIAAEDPPLQQARSDAFPTAAFDAHATDQTRPLLPPDDPEPSGLDLTRQEREVVHLLTGRVGWMERHIPTTGTMMGFALVACIPLSLLLYPYLQTTFSWMNQFPPLGFISHIPGVPSNLLATIGKVFTTLIGLCIAFRKYREWRRDMAQKDLLDFYQLCMAYRMTIREDQLRVAAVAGPLATEIYQWYRQLRQMQTGVRGLRDQFRHLTDVIERDLFNGPSGVRDVFIANGQVLSPQGYTLEDLNEEVDRLRLANVADEYFWHHSYEDIHERLRHHLAWGSKSAIEALSRGQADALILPFMRDVINYYLTGRLVEIGYAMSGMGNNGTQLWRKALDKATLLFNPPNRLPSTLFFAGRDEDAGAIAREVIPRNAVQVHSSHAEWLFIVQLNPGGGGMFRDAHRQRVGRAPTPAYVRQPPQERSGQ